jgi:hypothetical protein
MAWIESHQALGQHPKTLAFAAALHCSLPTAVGHLQYLWWWALDYAQDGLVTARTQPVAVRACQVQRQPERFWDALIDAGFVDVVDQDAPTWRIHDWSEYAGRLIDRRKNDAERKREARRTADGNPADGARTSGSRPVVPTNQPDQPTGHNQPDRTQPTVKTAGRHRARTHEDDPKLLAEHLMRIAQEQASRAMPSQPLENSSETNGTTTSDADG